MVIGLILMFIFFFSASCYAEQIEAFISTPNPCVKIEKVDGSNIYLAATKPNCIQAEGITSIKIDSSIKKVFVYFNDAFWKEQEVKKFDIGSLSDKMEQVEKYQKEIKIEKNPYADKMKEEAEKTYKHYQSDEFQAKIQKETERIKKDLGVSLDPFYSYYKDTVSPAVHKQKLRQTERIYILISSSMPLETIRAYVKDAATIGDRNIVFVMRGFVDGMKYIIPTIKFAAKSMFVEKDCNPLKSDCKGYTVGFQVDPNIFRRYGVQKVPAVIYVPNITVSDPEMSEGIDRNAKVPDYYVVYGDASLHYLLEQIHKETKSIPIKSIMEVLKKI